MPKIVDREGRRREIVDAYLALVAREGVAAATTRRLAQELGVATGALWHYFKGFDEVLQRAFERIFEATNARIDSAVADREGLDALCAMLEQIHPLDKTTGDEANVVVSFWGRVPFHAGMASFQAEVERAWHRAYELRLDEAVVRGELREDAPTRDLADALLTLMSGAQIEYVIGTPLGRADRQWRSIATVLGSWLTEAGRAAARLDERTAARG